MVAQGTTRYAITSRHFQSPRRMCYEWNDSLSSDVEALIFMIMGAALSFKISERIPWCLVYAAILGEDDCSINWGENNPIAKVFYSLFHILSDLKSSNTIDPDGCFAFQRTVIFTDSAANTHLAQHIRLL